MKRRKAEPTEPVIPDGYVQGSGGILRCLPGSTTPPHLCEWHAEHHWCTECQGFYGIPHSDYSCHMHQAVHGLILPGSSRPDPLNCACRFCKTWKASGHAAARALVNERKEAGSCT